MSERSVDLSFLQKAIARLDAGLTRYRQDIHDEQMMRQTPLSRRVGTILPGSAWTKQRRHIASASDVRVVVSGGME